MKKIFFEIFICCGLGLAIVCCLLTFVTVWHYTVMQNEALKQAFINFFGIENYTEPFFFKWFR